jgi:hypothetical protein
MTPARVAEIIAHIDTLATVAEAHAFRDALRDNGEALTTEAYRALLARIELLNRRGMA